MSTGNRLIIFLTFAVGVVMTLGGYLILSQRESILETAMRNELRAHAATLKIALEDTYRAGRTSDAQRLINRLSADPKVYSVTLFDETGRSLMSSNPLAADEIRNPPQVLEVIATGQTIELVSNQDLVSLIVPIRISDSRRGAFEITQPSSFIKADFARARRDIALVALALFATIILVVLVVMRHSLLTPIKELLVGAGAIGRGDFEYRVIVPESGGELAQLANEFNRMADNLSEQRRVAINEAEGRLRLERELRHKDRLASVGRLAAGIAHEMGAPLNVIKGRVELLRQRLEMHPEGRSRNFDIITEQIDGIAQIIRQLLTLARPFNLPCEAIDSERLIADVCELIELDVAKAEIDLQVDLKNGSRINGNRDFLRQVILNISLNGIQAVGRNGKLKIEMLDGDINRDGRSFVALRISDNGPGIPSENLEHIFDPFFTTKDIGQGVGLGLAVSHRIVEEHGGWIEATNAPEGGASFTVYLPKMHDQAVNEKVEVEGINDERASVDRRG